MFFYRLVKFESTKSLASTSSRSLGGALSENGDRETALQNVLTFIAEQQKFVQMNSRPCSLNDITKEFNIEAPPQHIEDLKNCECDNELCLKTSVEIKTSDNENYVTLKQLCTEYNMNEQNKEAKNKEDSIPGIAYAEEVCLVTPIDVESENCSNITEHPVDICSSINVELSSTDYQQVVLTETNCDEIEDNNIKNLEQSDSNFSDNLSQNNTMSESLTSSISTPDTVISKIPRRVNYTSKIPISPAKINNSSSPKTSSVTKSTSKKRNQSPETSKIPKSKVNYKNSKIIKPKTNLKQQKIVVNVVETAKPLTSERLPQCTSAVLSNIIDGPPHRAVSFHERATSKDVIDELNRMIKNGDESTTNQENSDVATSSRLDEACRSTGWIHVEKDIDLNDPKVRIESLTSK